MDYQDIEQNIETELHVSRYILVYKLILGLIELFFGLGTLFFSVPLGTMYYSFKAKEFMEDPHDLLVSIIEKILPFFLKHKDYITLLLIILGLIKVVGAIGLYYRRHWGLDLLIGVTVLLLPFDTYHFLVDPSILKFIFVLVNLFIALYLVNFKPKDYFINLTNRAKKRH